MTAKHYRIGTGYVGAYGGSDNSSLTAELPTGAVECPAPARGDDVWNEESEAWDGLLTAAERGEATVQAAVAKDMASPLTRVIIDRLGDEIGFRAALVAEHNSQK